MATKVFMLGWEFPPYISGGLGTACHGLVRAMERLRLEMLFMLPMAMEHLGHHGKGPAATPEGKGPAPKPYPGQPIQFRGIPPWFSSPYPSSVKSRSERSVQPVAGPASFETAAFQKGP